MNETLIQNGTDLMLFGMGTVLMFLTLLALVTVLMSSIVRRWFPEPEGLVDKKPPSNASGKKSGAKVDDRVMAAIKGAIEQHRAKRR